MLGFREFELGSQGEKSQGKYMVCVGGYPREAASTFAEAEARACDLLWFEPDGDFSIYEVETGIHFDVPKRPRSDEGVMPGGCDAYFARFREMR